MYRCITGLIVLLSTISCATDHKSLPKSNWPYDMDGPPLIWPMSDIEYYNKQYVYWKTQLTRIEKLQTSDIEFKDWYPRMSTALHNTIYYKEKLTELYSKMNNL